MSVVINQNLPATKVADPRVCKPIIQGGRSYCMLAPLAGVTAQRATPYTSEWLPVGAGAFLQLTLSITRLAGTLSVMLETVGDPDKDPPRFCGTFPQANAAGTVKTTMVSDAFVRVVATPGAATDQAADWTITGDAILSGAPGM
jgi:hypothetical protein